MNKKLLLLGIGIIIVTALTYADPLALNTYTEFGIAMLTTGIGLLLVGLFI